MKTRTTWLAIIKDVLLICVFIGMFTIWKTIIQILTTKLEADDKIVHGKIGLLHIQTLDSPINKITSIKVDQSLFGRIFNYGSIFINTAGGNFIFHNIVKPNEFKNYVLEKMN